MRGTMASKDLPKKAENAVDNAKENIHSEKLCAHWLAVAHGYIDLINVTTDWGLQSTVPSVGTGK